MPTYEELLKLGAEPEAASAKPADKGLTYDQLVRLGATPGAATKPEPAAPSPAPQKDYGTFDAVAREAGNIFGAGPAIQAGLETAVSKIPIIGPKILGTGGYEDRRKAYADALDVGRAAHPVATGIASAARGVGEAAGTTLLAPGLAALTPLKAGLLFGTAEGTGEALSHGETGAAMAARAVKSGAAGAAAGKVVGGIVGKLVGREAGAAEERLRKVVGNDIVGDKRGASTATARKFMADDYEDVADVVTRDRSLETAIRKAKTQNPEKIGLAIDAVEARLAPTREARPQLYSELDKTIGGGVRSGDYVDHLESAATQLENTGEGADDAIAKQLRARADLLKRSTAWGGQSDVFDPHVKIGNNTAGELVDQYTQAAKNAANDAQRSGFEEAIANVKAAATTKAYDPDKIVPTARLRDNVTDLQKTAYDAYGGINGTNSYQRSRQTAGYAEEFLRDLKAGAKQSNPDLIARLNEHDKTVSALLHVNDVLKQRFNRATVDTLSGTDEGVFGQVAHAAAHGVAGVKGGVIREGVALGARGGIATGRAMDRGVRALEGNALAATVMDFMRQGMPLAAAIKTAQEVAQPEGSK